jgi:hypothetical protein
MAVVGFTKLEALFRKAASLDIHKGHTKEVTDIVEKKLHDLLLAAERNANINGRDVIWESDLPITKGMQESIIEFKKLDEELNIDDVLQFLSAIPPLKYPLVADLENKVLELTGALLVVVARVMKEIDSESRIVNHELIKKSSKILDFTL